MARSNTSAKAQAPKVAKKDAPEKRVPASQVGIPAGMKRCTKTGEVLPATPEFFYRDKSQHDGLAAWSKAAEKAYNRAYFSGLRAAKTERKRDIPTTGKGAKARIEAFESAMVPERVKRGTFSNAPVDTPKVTRRKRSTKKAA